MNNTWIHGYLIINKLLKYALVKWLRCNQAQFEHHFSSKILETIMAWLSMLLMAYKSHSLPSHTREMAECSNDSRPEN